MLTQRLSQPTSTQSSTKSRMKKGKPSAFSVHTARSNNILQLKKNHEINLQNKKYAPICSFKLPAIEDGEISELEYMKKKAPGNLYLKEASSY